MSTLPSTFANEQAASEQIAQQIERDQNTRSAKLATLVASVSEKLGFAQSVVDQATSQEAYKIGKEAMISLLAPVKEVVEILNIISDIHPAVKAVAGVLQIIVKMQIDRHENDKNIAVLHFTMSNFLFYLHYLDPVFSKMASLEALLTKFLTGVKDTMQSFGNFCDVYYKHGTLVRVLRSYKYKEQLAGFAGTFEDHRIELQRLLASKTAVAVTNVESTVGDVNKKVDNIISFIEAQTSKEKALTEKVTQLGGTEQILNDPALLKELGKEVGEEVTAQITFALHADLGSLLESNLGLFNLKVEAAVYQIQEAVDRSTDAIISKMDAGPHELIHDEDIRQVWKDMNWRVSCKGRHFVDAIHHFYSSKFAQHRYQTGEVHPHAWTLQFIGKVVFYPAIGDAVDEDGSGYISIHEVNHFVKEKPEKWSLPEWMAYWAVGWYQNALVYLNLAYKSADAIEEQAKHILKQNAALLDKTYYLKEDDGLQDLRLIIDSIYTDNLTYHGEAIDVHGAFEKLKVLREERMEEEKKAMRAQLLKTKFRIDDRACVLAVLGNHRVESSVMCLIHLLLQRHLKIFELAKKLVLADQEFESMADTIGSIVEAFETRLINLKEAWRQQRLDIKLQLSSFAAGIFEAWHDYYLEDDTDSESGSDSESNYWSDDIPDTPAIDPSTQDVDTPEQLLVYPLPKQPNPEDLKPADENDAKKEEGDNKKKIPVNRRLTAMEDRLTKIEDMLKTLVSALPNPKEKDQDKKDEKAATNAESESAGEEHEDDEDDGGDDEEAEEED